MKHQDYRVRDLLTVGVHETGTFMTSMPGACTGPPVRLHGFSKQIWGGTEHEHGLVQ